MGIRGYADTGIQRILGYRGYWGYWDTGDTGIQRIQRKRWYRDNGIL